ncbi:DMT family transporter [Campylobacter cuniculorum]|uniref:Guanidinium exporter n=2 Tax=Campylobacter cuniculorum TaxID=374106 RepID=A0A1W6BUH6_9BACT|nr:multidrug efflux SMR transporter [Campylobacter cuniculorum]ARJ55717.1 multidrug efflux system protein, EmrE family [Campylobacter cuniculorum DSM 23162 = LMG 24588]QOR04937.1 multidrug efflux SMR transporter [Campylobacter cuniculorum]
MSWIYLIIAGFMEILGVIVMKKFVLSGKKILILVLMFLFMLSFGFLSLAMRELSMGIAYAVWTGIGAAGGVICGVLFFKESKSILKFILLSLIIICSIGLKFIS